jgi:hypothetical protein
VKCLAQVQDFMDPCARASEWLAVVRGQYPLIGMSEVIAMGLIGHNAGASSLPTKAETEEVGNGLPTGMMMKALKCIVMGLLFERRMRSSGRKGGSHRPNQ